MRKAPAPSVKSVALTTEEDEEDMTSKSESFFSTKSSR